MNVSIIHKANVKSSVLDEIARELPAAISGVLEIAGGKLAIIKPEQVALAFSEASSRDIGQDIRIMVFPRINDQRVLNKTDHAEEILGKVIGLIARAGEAYSVNIRLYFTEIGMAQHVPD